MIGGGAHFQVSGLGRQVPGSGNQVQVQVREICHLPSAISPVIDSAAGYVVTRSRPYLETRPPPVLDTQYSILSASSPQALVTSLTNLTSRSAIPSCPG